MKVIVLGATGFVGRYVIAELVRRNHTVIAVGRRPAIEFDSSRSNEDAVRYVECDLYQAEWGSPLEKFGSADAVIDLVWPGLPNYRDVFHFETNQPNSYRMLKRFVDDGFTNVLSTGTCYEYGLQSGPLAANSATEPMVAYGVAKDGLRRWLQMLQLQIPFQLKWARLFYVHGEGQFAGSLIPQLQKAIANGDQVFNMSAGEQLRDFLTIGKAAEQLVNLTEHPTADGAFNICSGQPTSVRSLVEQVIVEQESSIRLNLGHYPYPSHEPLAFWGVPSPAAKKLTGA